MKTPKDAAQDWARRARRLEGLPQRAGRDLTAAVQGHRGESTITAASTGSGARVTISGSDAAKQRAAVHNAAQAALRKAR